MEVAVSKPRLKYGEVFVPKSPTIGALIEAGHSPTEAILVTLHETTAVFERVYMRLRPENFKQMAATRAGAQQIS